MIIRLKEMLDQIVDSIELGEHGDTMLNIARFTVLLEEFLRQYKNYIFAREILNLNRQLMQVMNLMQQDDLQGIKEVLDSSISGFLNDWDFKNNSFN